MNSHGGNIKDATRRYELKKSSLIDFSASINPLGLTDKLKKAIFSTLDALPHYPDPECAELKEEFSRHLKIPADNLLFGNGSAELIFLIARALKIKKALISTPTFSEYENAVKINSGECLFLKTSENNGFRPNIDNLVKGLKKSDALFICNPNNPTGYLLDKGGLDYLAKECVKNNAFLIIDEVFIDFVKETDNFSMFKDILSNKKLLILRSLTKFFALAGLRLGYLAAESKLIEKISLFQPPWSVNSLAQTAGVVAINNTAFIKKSQHYVSEQGKIFFQKLKKIKYLKPYAPITNFIFCKIESANINSRKLRDYCGQAGMLIRDCSNFRGLNNKFIRLAVRKEEENQKLIRVLLTYSS